MKESGLFCKLKREEIFQKWIKVALSMPKAKIMSFVLFSLSLVMFFVPLPAILQSLFWFLYIRLRNFFKSLKLSSEAKGVLLLITLTIFSETLLALCDTRRFLSIAYWLTVYEGLFFVRKRPQWQYHMWISVVLGGIIFLKSAFCFYTSRR